MAYKRVPTTVVENNVPEKVQSEFFLNVYDDTTEEARSLPYGLGLDGMPRAKDTSDWGANANEFLDELLEKASELEPGEERAITLVVKIKRRPAKVEATKKHKKLAWA